MRDDVVTAGRRSRRMLAVRSVELGVAAAAAYTGVSWSAPAADASSPIFVLASEFGATGDGINDDTAALQAALDAGGEASVVWIPQGTYVVRETLVVRSDRLLVSGTGTLRGSMANAPIIRFENVRACGVSDTLLFDGQWTPGVIAVELVGSLLGRYSIRADRVSLGVRLASSTLSKQNNSLNSLEVVVYNGIGAMTFAGSPQYPTCDNRVITLDWWGSDEEASTGVEFEAWADNNSVDHAYLRLNRRGSIGVAMNTQAPGHEVGVYENHGNYIVESEVPGTTGILGNRTQGRLGVWTTFLRLRLSGAEPPSLKIRPDCDIKLVNSNLGRGGLIVGQSTTDSIWIPGLSLGAGGPQLSSTTAHHGLELSGEGNSEVAFSTMLPQDWNQFGLSAYWTSAYHEAATTFLLRSAQMRPGQAPTPLSARVLHEGSGSELQKTAVSTNSVTGELFTGTISVSRPGGTAITLVGLMLSRTL